MKKSIWIFITVSGLFILIAVLFLFSFLFQRMDEFNVAYEETTVSKFKICSIDNPIANEDSACGNSFLARITVLYACGYVNAAYLKPGRSIGFRIYLIYVDSNRTTLPLYQNEVEDQFTIGSFCRKIIVPKNTKPGLYSVKVYFYRKTVAATQFELK